MSPLAALVYPSLGTDPQCVVILMRGRVLPQSLLENYRLLQAAQAGPQANKLLGRKLEAVEMALAAMDPEHVRLLRLLYMEKPRSRVMIQQLLNISEATYYRRKKDALQAFNLAMATIPDLLKR